MRENKFRAYDKINKRFIYVALHPTYIAWPSPSWVSQGLLQDTDSNIEGVSFSGIEEWQQYANLRDRKSKEVYEGHIIKVITQEGSIEEGEFQEEISTIHQVIWCDDYPSFDLQPPLDCESNGLQYAMIYYLIEIIGNGSENPELLRKEQ